MHSVINSITTAYYYYTEYFMKEYQLDRKDALYKYYNKAMESLGAIKPYVPAADLEYFESIEKIINDDFQNRMEELMEAAR